MKKRIILIFSLVFLFTIVPVKTCSTALAYREDNIIQPLWDNTEDLDLSISTSNYTVEIDCSIISKNHKNITGTVYLEKYTNGRWSTVTSWTIDGNGTVLLSKSYRGTSGYSYRVRLSANVEGERISATSNTVRL